MAVAINVATGNVDAAAIARAERLDTEIGQLAQRGHTAGDLLLEEADLSDAARTRCGQDLSCAVTVNVGHRHADAAPERLLKRQCLGDDRTGLGIHQPNEWRARGTDVGAHGDERRGEHLPRFEHLDPKPIAAGRCLSGAVMSRHDSSRRARRAKGRRQNNATSQYVKR